MLAREHPFSFERSHDGQESGRSPVSKTMEKTMAPILATIDPALSRRLQATGLWS
jgi:hypothetical protein